MFPMKGHKAKTTLKSNVLKIKKIKAIAAIQALSPILLRIIAFKADFVAEILVCQKLIKRKEQIPIPSQPKNKTKKLSAVTKTNIKKVKRESNEKNLIKLESPAI